MQPTNAAPFNPLDFKKLSQQEQFEAARTMNQKELIAVAGTGVPLETLLKYQGLSDTEIQKRLKDLNPYLAEFSLINQRDNIKAMAAEKRSHAEFYAMLEEQSHAPTQAGHKLGNIANLAHDQQVHALAEHFSHGGAMSEALDAMGVSKEAQERSKELDSEYDQAHREELESIRNIQNEKERKKRMDEYNRNKNTATANQLKIEGQITDEQFRVVYAGVQAGCDNFAGTTMSDGHKITARDKGSINNDIEISNEKIKNKTASKIDILRVEAAKLLELDKDQQEKYMKEHEQLAKDLIECRVKNLDKTTCQIIQGLNLKEGKVSDVKDLEKAAAKAASAEALKTTTVAAETEAGFGGNDIPKLGSIKVASWQNAKQNTEAAASVSSKTTATSTI